MKVLCYLHLLTVVVSSEFVPAGYHPWRRTQLTAVTHFENFEQFYLKKMRLQKPKSYQEQRNHPIETAEIKRTLCEKILSHHDRVDQEFVLKLDVGEVRRELRDDDENLYGEIFLPSRTDAPDGGCYCAVGSSKRKYVNPYVAINAVVEGEIVTEYVFKCLTRDIKSRNIIQYYISEEYNVNVRTTAVNNIVPAYITGRFVFTLDEEDEWRLLEMAEEGAILTPLEQRDTYERLYLRYRKKEEIVEDPANDPVCGLNRAYKLRLCVSVMNTSEMKGRGRTPQFVPKYHNFKPETQLADERCVKREVRLDADVRRTYEEWTISCQVETLHETETRERKRETIIVSQGYKMNSVFVFTLLKSGKIAVDHHSFNVSVVDDRTAYTQLRGPARTTAAFGGVQEKGHVLTRKQLCWISLRIKKDIRLRSDEAPLE